MNESVSAQEQVQTEIAFSRKAFGGYDPAGVDETIDNLQDQIRKLKAINDEQSRSLGAYHKSLKESLMRIKQLETQQKKEEKDASQALLAAQQKADMIIAHARVTAEQIVEKARQEADEIVSNSSYGESNVGAEIIMADYEPTDTAQDQGVSIKIEAIEDVQSHYELARQKLAKMLDGMQSGISNQGDKTQL